MNDEDQETNPLTPKRRPQAPAPSDQDPANHSTQRITPPSPTPRHDLVQEHELSHYQGLFRDSDPGDSPLRSTAPRPTPPPNRQPPGFDSTSTQVMGAPAAPGMGHAGAMAPGQPPAAPAQPPVGPGKPRRKKRRWGRILLAIIAVFVAYATILATVFAFSVNKIDALPADQIGSTAGTNYLLVGSDGRQSLTTKEQNRLHVGDVEGNRTDTIMILHVPLLGQPTLVSIPRDSWVPIPGHNSNKINAAFALGGPQLLVQTVEQTTGLHIDNYVEIGMIGVARVADALGGLTLCPDRRYKDKDSNLNVKKGCQEMDGLTALAYVRMRKADPRGDLGRAERQQEYIKAASSKAMSPLSWLNPFKMFSVVSTAGESLTVSEGTGIIDDTRMGVAMAMISKGWGESVTVPIADKNYWVNGQEAIKWDTPNALKLFASLGG